MPQWKGEERGRAEGIAEGRTEGIAEGRTEATHEMILKMHEQGISLDTIAVVTGLQVSDVRTIISAEK